MSGATGLTGRCSELGTCTTQPWCSRHCTTFLKSWGVVQWMASLEWQTPKRALLTSQRLQRRETAPTFLGVPHLFPKDAGVSRSTLPSLGGKSHDYVLIAAVTPGPPPTLAGCWLEVLHPESLSVLIPWTVFIPPDPKVPTPGNVQEKDDPFY